MSGFVKEHRQILEWGWYKDVHTCHLFRHLILKAQWKPTTFRDVALSVGQLLTGRKTLAFETGLTEQQVRTALSNLQKHQEITIKSTSKFSIITVCNYSKYQAVETAEQPALQPALQPANSPTNNQQSTSNQPAANHMQDYKTIKTQETVKTQYTIPADSVSRPVAIKKLRSKSGAKSAPVWKAYSEAYRKRHGTDPLRDMSANVSCCQLVDSIGIENAPAVAAWYVSSNDSYVVAAKHPLQLLVRDRNKYHTEWATGSRTTQTAAREQDRLSAVGDAWANVIEKYCAEEED